MLSRPLTTSKGLSSTTSFQALPASFSEEQLRKFDEDGYLIVDKFMDANLVQRIRDKFPLLFRGEFETGVYPDEWHWREGMSRDDVTREMVNVWKSDLTIASVVCSESLGRLAAQLMRWQGTRVAQDDIWWKPPGAGAVSFHQDSPYFDFLEPAGEVLTCWLALDETRAGAGTLQYVRGSHKWRSTPAATMLKNEFFTAKDYHAALKYAVSYLERNDNNKEAKKDGNSQKQTGSKIDVDIVPVVVPPGGVAFHHGAMWHGSEANTDKERIRRSLAIHFIPHHAKFRPHNVGYIYGRYKLHGREEMEETFFPITWTTHGYRSPSLHNCPPDPLTPLNNEIHKYINT